MSEDVIKEAEQTQEQEGKQSEAPEFSEVEQEALAQGWVPKEEFEGDEGRWVEAGEFLRRGELFKKIDSQGRALKDTQRALQEFRAHYTKVQETEFKRALATLKAERKAAFQDGDFDKATEIEEKIEATQEEAKAVQEQISTVAQDQQINPAFATWVSKNDWYATQPHMKTFADYKGFEYAKLGLTPEEVLKKVEQEVKKEFPNKFKNPNQAKAPSVEGGVQQRGGSGKAEAYTMTEQERRVMKNLTSMKNSDGSPFITEAKYIADLKKIKGVS